jgi:hypothetical protein
VKWIHEPSQRCQVWKTSDQIHSFITFTKSYRMLKKMSKDTFLKHPVAVFRIELSYLLNSSCIWYSVELVWQDEQTSFWHRHPASWSWPVIFIQSSLHNTQFWRHCHSNGLYLTYHKSTPLSMRGCVSSQSRSDMEKLSHSNHKLSKYYSYHSPNYQYMK